MYSLQIFYTTNNNVSNHLIISYDKQVISDRLAIFFIRSYHPYAKEPRITIIRAERSELTPSSITRAISLLMEDSMFSHKFLYKHCYTHYYEEV